MTSTLSASISLAEMTLARSVRQPSLPAASRQAVSAVLMCSSAVTAKAWLAAPNRVRVAAEATISLEREWGALGIAEGPAWVGKKGGKILVDSCSPFPVEMARVKAEQTY